MQRLDQCKTTALSLSDSITPCFNLIYDLFSMNAPIIEIVSIPVDLCHHRYTPEIPKPAPSLLRHGAEIWGLWVFPVIKITLVRQVRWSPASTAVRT